MGHSKGKVNSVKGKDRARVKVNRAKDKARGKDRVKAKVKVKGRVRVRGKMVTARVKVMGRAAAPKVRAHSREIQMVGREAHGAARPLTK